MAGSSRFSDPKHGISFRRIQNDGWKVDNRTYTWYPPTDVYETQEDFIIKVEVAGMKQSEITIHIEDKLLVVSGTRKDDFQQRAYQQIEIRSGDFSTSVVLPEGLALNDAMAEYDDGFLKVSIPIIKPKKIEIRGK